MERAMNGSYLVCSEQTKVFAKLKLKKNARVFIPPTHPIKDIIGKLLLYYIIQP
jgi:hypothetical protein